MKARLIRQMPGAVLAALALGHAGLIVAQAELLARAIAALDATVLPWLAVVVTARAGLGWAAGGVARRAASELKASMRSALLARAAHKSGAGELVTLVTKGLDALDPYLVGYVPQLFTAAIVPPIVLLRLGFADWTSALIVAVTLPLVPIFGALIGLRTRDVTRHQWTHLRRLGGHFRDVLAGLSTLRAFDRTTHQAGVITSMADGHRAATMSALRVAFLSGFVLELVCSLSVALVAVPVGLRLLDGRLALTTGLVVLLLTPEAFLPLRALGTKFHAGAEGLAVAETAYQRMETELASTRPGKSAPALPEIRFDNVTVRYDGVTALDGVSFVLRPGERVAFVGPSGAGKTTVLNVLLGFVTPDAGRVLVDGVDLRELDLASWRQRLAWVPQSPHLFTGSVADNIRLGSPAAAEDRVREAAAAAHAASFVAAPVTDLSAGERQRVALARAHLRDAPIVLLDEPTARLDVHSEAAVVSAADALLTGRTALLVAHRPALVAIADRVIRFDSGKVAS